MKIFILLIVCILCKTSAPYVDNIPSKHNMYYIASWFEYSFLLCNAVLVRTPNILGLIYHNFLPKTHQTFLLLLINFLHFINTFLLKGKKKALHSHCIHFLSQHASLSYSPQHTHPYLPKQK